MADVIDLESYRKQREHGSLIACAADGCTKCAAELVRLDVAQFVGKMTVRDEGKTCIEYIDDGPWDGDAAI